MQLCDKLILRKMCGDVRFAKLLAMLWLCQVSCRKSATYEHYRIGPHLNTSIHSPTTKYYTLQYSIVQHKKYRV